MEQYCTRCGTKKVDNMSFCPMCGRSFDTPKRKKDFFSFTDEDNEADDFERGENPENPGEVIIEKSFFEKLDLVEKIKNNYIRVIIAALILIIVILGILIISKMDILPQKTGNSLE